MYKSAILIAACFALVVWASSASGEVYPEEYKTAFDHGGVPWPEDHEEEPVVNFNPMPWYWHPEQTIPNVAGIKFTIKYDPYEVDILGITPTFRVGGNVGHYRFTAPGPTLPTSGTPVPANSVPATVAGTVWIPASIANQTGVQVTPSAAIPILDLRYQPKHTSHYSDPQFNSEVDVVVSNLQPILHPPGQHIASVSVYDYKHALTDMTDGAGVVMVNASESYWARVHLSSVTRVPLGVSDIIYPGPLAATTTVAPPSGIHLVTVTILPSVWVHEEPYSDWYHVDTSIRLTQFYYPQSVFVVGATVAGAHVGMAIDHVPEPFTLGLLGLGGAALLRHASFRRRRRA